MRELNKLLNQAALKDIAIQAEELIASDKIIAGLEQSLKEAKANAYSTSLLIVDALKDEKSFPSSSEKEYHKQVARAIKELTDKSNSY